MLSSLPRSGVTWRIGGGGGEFALALAIGSASLFADSIDFLEDATVNGLILVALGSNARPGFPHKAPRDGWSRSTPRAGARDFSNIVQIRRWCTHLPSGRDNLLM